MKKEKAEGVLISLSPELRNSRRDIKSFTRKPSSKSLLSQLSTKEKVLPHYLTASAGSCHDFCKYGGNHTAELKGRDSSFPLPSSIGMALLTQRNRVNVQTLAERQRKSPQRQKAMAPKFGSQYGGKDWGKKTQLLVKRFNLSLPSENIKETTTIPEISTSYAESGIKGCITAPSEGFKTMKKGALQHLGSFDDSASVTKNAPSFMKKTEASRNSETAGVKKHSAQNSFKNFAPQIGQKSLLSTFGKPISSGKSKVFKQEDTSHVKKFDASSKQATSEKSNTSSVKSESLLRPTAGMKGGNSRRKIVKIWNPTASSLRKNLKSRSGSLLPQPPVDHVLRNCNSAKSTSTGRHPKTVEQTELGDGQLRERALYLIGPKTSENEDTVSAQSKSSRGQRSLSSPYSSSSPSSPSSSSPSFSDHEGEYQDSESAASKQNDTVFEEGGHETSTTSRTGDKRHHGTDSTAHQEDEDETLCELRIRRGKILNLQPDNYVTGDSRSGEGEMKKIKFKANEPTNSNRTDPEAETVVLRHQDVQDKRGVLGLFNHVIEETASKLVETRRSKVKALVGAFETVISLQEGKSADSSV
ncbi:unnamed protein product [Spirodela intermedia]|uniref:Calmodulin-binding domain-containing protein n=1 Tax=Spirodela intermedia TaxID=51605 RepID=A0A7I8K912_SPIIN|nr:unnamed protein product [Spirodela intermedia]